MGRLLHLVQPQPQPEPSPQPGGALASLARSLLVEEERWAAQPQECWGLSTGFPSWDRATGGLHPGEVTILAARTSSGKTSLQLQVTLQVAETLQRRGDPGRAVVVSPEMTLKSLLTRAASIQSRVSSRRVRRGQASQQEREAWRRAIERLGGLDLWLEVRAGRTLLIYDLVQELEALHRERPVRLLVVDYLQVVTAGGRSAYEDATEVSRQLRALANRLDIPILALSQLARPADRLREPPPSLYEIRDSGNVEQDADNVLLLYRPLTLGDGDGPPARANQAIVTIAKQRNGPLGSFRLGFEPGPARFNDLGEVTLGGE